MPDEQQTGKDHSWPDVRIPQHAAGKTISLVSSCARIIRSYRIAKGEGAPNQYEIAILATLQDGNSPTSKDISDAYRISKTSISTALRTLRTQGQVKTVGSGKGAIICQGKGFADGLSASLAGLGPLEDARAALSEPAADTVFWFLAFCEHMLADEHAQADLLDYRSLDLATRIYLAATIVIRCCRASRTLSTLSATILETVWRHHNSSSQALFQNEMMALGNQSRGANDLLRQGFLKHNGQSRERGEFMLSASGRRLFEQSAPEEMQEIETLLKEAVQIDASGTDEALGGLLEVSLRALREASRRSETVHEARRSAIRVKS